MFEVQTIEMVIEFLVFLLRVGFKSNPKEKPHVQKMVSTIYPLNKRNWNGFLIEVLVFEIIWNFSKNNLKKIPPTEADGI